MVDCGWGGLDKHRYGYVIRREGKGVVDSNVDVDRDRRRETGRGCVARAHSRISC